MTTIAPCSWPLPEPIEDSVCPPCDALDALAPEEQERFIDMAVGLLWSWTERKFGLCEITVRPCRAECVALGSTMFPRTAAAYLPSQGWLPALIGGEWFNIGCGTCHFACTCAPSRCVALELPGPVAGITSITVGGEPLDPAAYHLRDGVLYRTDGECWPECNSQSGDVSDPDSGAWEIVYQRGLPVPVGGQIAAYRLACELAKAACNDSTCQLPSNVRSVTRQGVSMEMVQTEFEDMKDGKTGIWLIDSWVASEKNTRTAAPGVFSPDIPRDRGIGTLAGTGRGRTR